MTLLSEVNLIDLSLEDLMKIKITTAGKKEEQIADIPASVVVISREEIEKFGYQSLLEIIENVTGFYSINDYGWDGPKLGVRGFFNNVANDDIMICINGIDQVSDVYSNYSLYKISVPVEAIERIEIVRGPMSVMYGNSAFFGVINIITMPIAGNKNKGIASASIGSAELHKLFLRSSGGNDDFKYSINAGYSSTGGIDQPYSKMVNDVSVMPTSSTKGLLEGSEKYFSFYGSFNHFYADVMFTENENEGMLLLPSADDGSVVRFQTTNSVLGYKNKLSDKFSIEAKLGLYYTSNKTLYDWLRGDEITYQELPSRAYDVNVNTFVTPNKLVNLTMGFTYRCILEASNNLHFPSVDLGVPGSNNILKLADDDNINTYSLFAQADFNLSPKLKLVAGLRLERLADYTTKVWFANDTLNPGAPLIKQEGTYSQGDMNMIPRLGMIYNLNNNHVIKFLYGKAINHPSWFQNMNEVYSGKKPELKDEVIETYELNFITTVNPKLAGNASFFMNKLNNLITRVQGFDENHSYYTDMSNFGKMETWGVEISSTLKPWNGMQIELSTTYQKTKDRSFPDIDAAYSPKFLGYLKASYMFSELFSIGISCKYVGAMKAAWNINPDGTSGRIGNDVGGNFTVTTNLRYNNLFGTNLYFDAKCSNLFNADIYYPTISANNPFFTKGTLGMGRNVTITVGLKF